MIEIDKNMRMMKKEMIKERNKKEEDIIKEVIIEVGVEEIEGEIRIQEEAFMIKS